MNEQEALVKDLVHCEIYCLCSKTSLKQELIPSIIAYYLISIFYFVEDQASTANSDLAVTYLKILPRY